RDRTACRPLPRVGQGCRHPRRPVAGRGLRRDPGRPRAGRGGGVIIRKSAQEIEQMAQAGALVAETIALVGEQLEPGVSMLELDRIAEEHILSKGGVPTSKGYKGYPAALCISPNAMVAPGIPTD